MLVPLGVLSVGAVLAGMIWYAPFFGDHDRVNKFYGIPSAHVSAEGADAHGEGVVAAAEELAEGDVDHAVEAVTADHGAETGDDHGEAAAATLAAPGEGAIYMAPDNHVMDDAHHAPVWVKVSPFVAMLLGFSLAWLMYIRYPLAPAALAKQQRPLYEFLLNKWYFDELYDYVFVRPAQAIGRFFWKRGDGGVIDGGINGMAMGVVPFFTRLAGRAQSGYVFTYAFAMVLGLALLLTWMTLAGGAE